MLKSICCGLLVLFVCAGAGNVVNVSESPIPVPTPVVEPQVQGFSLNGPADVVTGNILRITVDGIESKVVEGVRLPKIRVGIDPPTENLVKEDSGYRLYLSEPLAKGQTEKLFTITVSVNNPDPNEPPLMIMRRFKITSGLEPEPAPGPVNPDKPGPVGPIPDDRFGNVGKAVAAAKAEYPADKCKALAELYSTTADKLENREYVSFPSAHKALAASRDWSWGPKVAAVITESWNKNYESFSQADYIEFCRAVAGGLR